MNWFFNEWFLNSGHPVLDINYSYDKDSLYVTIEQKHNTQKELTYQLPFKIGMWYGKNYETHDVTLRKKSESFAFKTAGKPDLIDFDAERFVLCEKKENKTIGNYIFQYNNAPLFLQRLEALKKLAEEQKNNDTAKTVLLNAMNDKFFYLRQFAVKKYDLPKENNEAVLAVVEKLAKSDSFSSVRKEALEKLSKSTSAKNYAMLFQISTGDSSYEVAAAALKALTEVDSKKALAFAKQFEAEKNYNIAGAVADVYAKEGDSTYQSFFDRKLRSVGGFAKYYAFYYYANFLTRMEKPIVLNGLRTIEEEASSTQNHFLGGASKGAVKRIAKSFEDKKKKAQDDMSSEKNEKTKLELQEKISNCDTIIQTANDVLARLNKPAEQKKN
jgi:aminopeptidase N